MAEGRIQSYDGEIIKCPNCGAQLHAMEIRCPECGYELRNAGVSKALKDFSVRLQNAKTRKDMIPLISSYPIPNTKEDFLEFLSMAAGAVSESYVSDSQIETAIHEAWISKYKQLKVKAPILFVNDPATLAAIEKIFKANKPKRKMTSFAIFLIVLLLGMALLYFFVFSSAASGRKKLENLYDEIVLDISNGDYDSAQQKLPKLRGGDGLLEQREWDKRRKELEQILYERKNGN